MRVPILFAALALEACASTTVYPVPYIGDREKDAAADRAVNGFRYYEGAHFLIVYTDGKGGLKSEVKFLPDLTKKRSIYPYAYLAKNDTTLTFTNGMLSESKSVIDEAAIPKAAITALEKIALATIAAANQTDGKEAFYLPNPVLFKIQIDATTGKLELLKGETTLFESDAGIEATLVEPQK